MRSGATVLVTGATGQVARPVALALAQHHDVIGAARFRDTAARAELEGAGIRCAPMNLVEADLSGMPEQVEYVLHFAVVKSNRWGRDLDGNVGGVAALMERYQRARAFLHCSSTGIYRPGGRHPFAEDDALGDNHQALPYLSTYSICKIAAEGAARYGARRWQLPTTIARLNVPYGDFGGWPALHLDLLASGSAIPVHPDAPTVFQPIHGDDIVDMIPRLLDAASVPATVVNWAGEDAVSIEEWCSYLGELTGRVPEFQPTEQALQSVAVDVRRMHELVGPAVVPWRDGFRRMVAARRPDLLLAAHE
ncbi:MAG: NAD-dependent epimerase/dehydratase family protein [Mycobacteriales bacterium]